MQRQPSMLRSFGEISPKERYILYTYPVIYPIMNMYPVSYVYPVHIYYQERYIFNIYPVIYPIMYPVIYPIIHPVIYPIMYPVSYVYPVHIYHTPINVSNLCQATFKYLNIKSICTKYHYVTGDQVKFGIFLSFRERFDAAPLSGRPSPHD